MITKKITVRTMRKNDIAMVCAMIKALGAFFGDRAKGSRRHLLAYCFGRKKLSSVWLAFVSGEPAGFAITRDWINLTQGFRVRHVDFLFVNEEFRYAGVGTCLIRAVTRAAIHDGCGLLDIGASPDNKPANNLYRKLGFEKRTKRAVQYRMRLNKRK